MLVEEAKARKEEEEKAGKEEGEKSVKAPTTDEPTPIPPTISASSVPTGTTAPPSPPGGAPAGTGDGSGKGKRGGERGLTKPSIPDVYPQVMAIPIAKRPLFPGFYKAITIRDPQVAAAIQDMISRGQPYIGAFLFKDDAMDKDTISSVDEVHDVGTFCQITSAFPVNGDSGSITAVLYPHRRIKLSSLTNNSAEAPSAPSPASSTTAGEKPKTIDVETPAVQELSLIHI